MPLLKMTSIMVFSSSLKGSPLIGQLVSKGVPPRSELVAVMPSLLLVFTAVSEEEKSVSDDPSGVVVVSEPSVGSAVLVARVVSSLLLDGNLFPSEVIS